MIEQAIRDAVVAAVREAVSDRDDPLPLKRVAELVGTTTSALCEHARRPEGDPRRLVIEGPKGCRVVWRSELRRWLAAWPQIAPRKARAESAPTAPKTTIEPDEDTAAMQRTAARLRRAG